MLQRTGRVCECVRSEDADEEGEHCDRGIWTAKKRYILNVWDSEGVRYEDPKLKIMGIEAVKSSTPALVEP